MDWFINELPKPIIIDGLAPVGGSKRKDAGSKKNCVFCGKPTYRAIAFRPVCSYCASTAEAENVKMKW